MTYITKSATLYNGEGYIESHGVTVIDHGDTISIGRSEYPKAELAISDNEIFTKTSNPAWSVKWQ